MTEIITDINPQDLYGDLEADAYGGASPTTISGGGSRGTFYQIVNLFQGKSKHGKENVGKFYRNTAKKGEEPIYEYFTDFVGTIYYTAPIRELKDRKMKTLCSSCSGEFPDFRHKPPRCEEASAEDVAKALKIMKFDEASIPNIIKHVAPEGVLNQCAYRTPEGKFFDLCPSADRRLASRCKLGVHVVGFDHDRGIEWKSNLFGMNARADRKYTSPLTEFEMFCRGKKVPMFGWQVRIHTVATSGEDSTFVFAVDLKEMEPVAISDVAQIKAMKQRFYESKEDFMKRHAWQPTDKTKQTNTKEENRDEVEDE